MPITYFRKSIHFIREIELLFGKENYPKTIAPTLRSSGGSKEVNKHTKVLINNEKVRKYKPTLVVFFNKGYNCVRCGAKGKYFALENDGQGYNINLYAENSFEKEVIMTIDHIIPKSKGGVHNIDNLQPMCIECNTKKRNHNF